MDKNIVYSIILPFLICFFYSCAQIGSPTGGPKDSIPPEIIETTPPNFTPGYQEEELNAYIRFNEYVQLKKMNEKFYVSPPVENDPDIELKGKGILIKFNNTPEENTTYNLHFGDAISDLNESNPFGNFSYIFSTKPYIDTLSIAGYVKDAFTHEAVPDVWVMAYLDYNDSTPYLEKPSYIAKSDTAGFFSIEYICDSLYRIFAVNDQNNNLLFDLPNEPLAYLDSTIQPKARWIEVTDTLQFDSVLVDDETKKPIDTLQIDTVIHNQMVEFTPRNLELFLFEEDTKKQYIIDYKRQHPWKCTMLFNRRLWNDSLLIEPLNFSNSISAYTEICPTKDTVLYWIADTTISKLDTLHLTINYLRRDSTEKMQLVTDTLKMLVDKMKETETKKGSSPKKGMKKKETNTKSLELKLNVKANQTFDLNKNIRIETDKPIRGLDTTRIVLYKMDDTIPRRQTYRFYQDSINMRLFYLQYQFTEKEQYRLLIDTMAFTDIMYFHNDSVQFDFKTQSNDQYAALKVKVEVPKTGNYIFHLLDPGGNILQRKEKQVSEDEVYPLEYKYLKPDGYKLRIISDDNANGFWDTGNYLKNLQPERVYYYKTVIQLKASWENEIEWELHP